MSDSFMFTDTDDINNLDLSTNSKHPSTQCAEEEKQVNPWSELTLNESNSFVTILHRLCIYWRRILFNKIRRIFTLIFISMLNITTRITCFVGQRTSSSSSLLPSSFPCRTDASSSAGTLQEDFHDSSKSHLRLEKASQQPTNLSSLQNSKMTHILVQQQTHRSPNISIHGTRSSQKDSTSPMRHSVDDRLFYKDAQILNFLTRFASEPQMSKYNTQLPTTNGHITKSPVVFAVSPTITDPCLQYTESKADEIHFNDMFYLNCDKIEPVSTSSNEDLPSDKTDNIMLTTTDLSPEQVTEVNGDWKSQHLDEDVLLDTSPSINGILMDGHGERHFRRRKRRSSLTKNSISLDDNTSPIINSLEKLDLNQQQSQDMKENLELQPNDNEHETNIIETKTSENEESTNPTIVDEEKLAPVSRYRGRRLRHRFYRQSASVSTQEVTSNNSPEFYLPNDAIDIETPRNYSPPFSSPVPSSPLETPTSPTLTLASKLISTHGSTGGLKRVNSVGTTKKNVRFADSVGRQLTQVQYIHSLNNDESKEFSFLLGSSLLSSSPPSFSKNHLYVPNSTRLEHKPWSFDVALTPSQQIRDSTLPRRFFCLYRQPNSEHPDIYLHEVWKSQIKLEHADIPLKCSSAGEQQLTGTLWVTNASFSKYVSIKYTFNRWLNTCEYEAHHRCHSNDYRNIDQFEFSIDIPVDVDRIDFVLRYCINGQEYWDNNEGKNYSLQTESNYTPSTTISLPHDCDFNEMRFY